MPNVHGIERRRRKELAADNFFFKKRKGKERNLTRRGTRVWWDWESFSQLYYHYQIKIEFFILKKKHLDYDTCDKIT